MVTGAGSGLGLAFAEGLAKRGYDLLLVSLPGEGLKETADRLQSVHLIHCYSVEGDLCSPEVRRELIHIVEGSDAPLRVLVNNAGLGSTGPFLEHDADFYERQVMLNSAVPVLLTRSLLPFLSKTGQGHLLMVASLGAFLHVQEKAVYDATKAFIAHFSESVRPMLRESQVHLCVCFPGPINTNARLKEKHAGLHGVAKKMVMEPYDVAESSLVALFAKKKEFVPGAWNRWMNFLRALLPDAFVRFLLESRLKG